ncbi:MAG: PhoX family phosphatase [Terricaulis sp.]|nr:PhoX family phosphatase [Terricaulis sp.]
MTKAKHISELMASRRALLGGLAGLPLLNLAGCATGAARAPAQASLNFANVAPTNADTVTVPPGYSWRTLIAWGDPLFEGMSAFDPDALTRDEQEKRFGTHNDMLALFAGDYAFPPPKHQDRMILCANNEYVSPELTFPAVRDPRQFTPAQVEAMYAAIGVTVVEIARGGDGWHAVRNAAPGQGRNRRITPFTPVQFSGPAAHHPWIEAAKAVVNAAEPDRSGGQAPADAVRCGTVGNCAGGLTPWGTYLTAEENFHSVFYAAERNAAPGTNDADHARDARIFGYPWGMPSGVEALPRQFQFAQNPYGPSLYGWVLEIDPYDPNSTPKKRTALGRKAQECATTAITKDDRIAAYMGDDKANEHVYKFVTAGRFDPNNRAANMDLLDDGALYAARFEADGTGRWLKLTPEAANAAAEAQGSPARFRDAGDIAMRAREAANLLGATPMDRPEDVEAVCDAQWRGLGPVLIVCTKSSDRDPNRPGNPRRLDESGAAHANRTGHIIRIDEAGGDCAAEHFTWDAFVVGGDPNATSLTLPARDGSPAQIATGFGAAPANSGERFACPDNIFIDSDHRVWISTDGNPDIFADCNDQVLATPLDTEGPRPLKRFLVGPVGGEICGPLMAPDERAFFCAVQHPGESDVSGADFFETRWRGAAAPSSFPDGGWPRSAVVVVTRDDGGRIGD